MKGIWITSVFTGTYIYAASTVIRMNNNNYCISDMSLWDCFKEPIEEEFKGHSLMFWYNQLDRGNTRLGVAGKLMTAEEAQACLDEGMDFVLIGRGAILHYDFPNLAMGDPDWESVPTPASEEHLLTQFLSPSFVKYMKRSFKGFVEEDGVTADTRRKSNFKSKRKPVTT